MRVPNTMNTMPGYKKANMRTSVWGEQNPSVCESRTAVRLIDVNSRLFVSPALMSHMETNFSLFMQPNHRVECTSEVPLKESINSPVDILLMHFQISP